MNQQIKAYLISLARLFAAAVIAAYLALGKQPLELGSQDWKALANAGIAALIVSLANALNPADQRYGVGAPGPKDLSAGDVATNAPNDAGHSTLEVAAWIGAICLVLLVLFALFGTPG